jgi:hypothetical protein
LWVKPRRNFLDYLTLTSGTDRLSRNVGKQQRKNSPWHPGKAKAYINAYRSPLATQLCRFSPSFSLFKKSKISFRAVFDISLLDMGIVTVITGVSSAYKTMNHSKVTDSSNFIFHKEYVLT